MKLNTAKIYIAKYTVAKMYEGDASVYYTK